MNLLLDEWRHALSRILHIGGGGGAGGEECFDVYGARG